MKNFIKNIRIPKNILLMSLFLFNFSQNTYAQNSCVELLSSTSTDLVAPNSIKLSAQEIERRSQEIINGIYNILKFNPKSIASNLSHELSFMQQDIVMAGRDLGQFLSSKGYKNISQFSLEMERLELLGIELSKNQSSSKQNLQKIEVEIRELQNKVLLFLKSSESDIKSFEEKISTLENYQDKLNFHQKVLENVLIWLKSEISNTSNSDELKALLSADVLAPLLDQSLVLQAKQMMLNERLEHILRFKQLMQDSQIQATRAGGILLPSLYRQSKSPQVVSKKASRLQIKDYHLIDIMSSGSWSDVHTQLRLLDYLLNVKQKLSPEELQFIIEHFEMEFSGYEIVDENINRFFNHFMQIDVKYLADTIKRPVELINLVLAYLRLDRTEFVVNEGSAEKKDYRFKRSVIFDNLNRSPKAKWITNLKGYTVGSLYSLGLVLPMMGFSNWRVSAALVAVGITKFLLGERSAMGFQNRYFVKALKPIIKQMSQLENMTVLEEVLADIDSHHLKQRFNGKTNQSTFTYKMVNSLQETLSKDPVFQEFKTNQNKSSVEGIEDSSEDRLKNIKENLWKKHILKH